MKGTNLNATLVARLRDNIAGPGGLHHFDLSNSSAGPKELALIADSLKYNLQNIEGITPLISIDLSGNHICGVDFLMTGVVDNSGLQELTSALNTIGSRSRLRKIILSRNYLDTKGFHTIANLISSGFQSLSELYLRDCGANDEAMVKLMHGLKHAKNLHILDISHNKFGAEACEAISDALSVNSRLKQLMMSECDCGPMGAVCLMKGLSANLSLEALLLSDNNICDEGAEAVGLMLKVNNRLKHLDIQENCIGLSGAAVLAAALKVNRTLVFLGLQWNELTAEAVAPLCEIVSGNNVLRSIHLLGTDIDGDGIKKIMESSLLGSKLDIDVSFATLS
jgi:Ran GTPase-activating protein (RanGAP) involved in mRNA processing and transport